MVTMLRFSKKRGHEDRVVLFDDLKRFARGIVFHLKLRQELATYNATVECLNFDGGMPQFQVRGYARGPVRRNRHRRARSVGAPDVFATAHAIFKTLWNRRIASRIESKRTLDAEHSTIERQVEQFPDRIADTDVPSIVATCEKRIRDL